MQAQDLIPDHWDIEVESEDQILFLGKETIRLMIEATGPGSGYTEKTDKLLGIVRDRDFEALSSQYENPKFPHVDIVKDGRRVYRQPMDPLSLNRKEGATTFNVCGWCSHNCMSTMYGGAILSTHCQFEFYAGLDNYRAFDFDSTCFLKTASKEELDKIEQALVKTREEQIESEKKDTEALKRLRRLEAAAEKKPVLPTRKDLSWFNLNDKVVYYLKGFKDRLVEGPFEDGTIVNGFRHGDGCVNIYFDKKVHNHSNLNGHGFGCGIHRPEVMHLWEYEYLRNNPDFAKVWLNIDNYRIDEFDKEEFLKDLQNG